MKHEYYVILGGDSQLDGPFPSQLAAEKSIGKEIQECVQSALDDPNESRTPRQMESDQKMGKYMILRVVRKNIKPKYKIATNIIVTL